ncbi:MAG: GAF domain-containing protein [Chloroflexi bacterium]|nr:GAF domain-containing protein [Chloroflexota bacterium]
MNMEISSTSGGKVTMEGVHPGCADTPVWFGRFAPDGSWLEGEEARQEQLDALLASDDQLKLLEIVGRISPENPEDEAYFLTPLEPPELVHWRFSGVFPEDGQPASILAFHDRGTAQNAQLNLMWNFINLNNAPAGLLNGQGKIILLNTAAAEWLGKTSRELTGRFFFDLLSPGLGHEELTEMIEQVLRGEPVTFNLEGEDSLLEYSIAPIRDAQGAVTHFGLFSKDIHLQRAYQQELEESRLRLDLAIKGTQDGLWDWSDLDQDAEWWSPRLYELFGYQPGEFKPTVSGFFEMVHPDDRQRLRASLQEHLEYGGTYDITVRVRTKDGDYRWFRTRGTSIRNERGKPVRMAGSMQDISREMRAIDELGRRNDEIRMLYEGVRHLGESLEVADIFHSLHDTVQKMMPCNSLFVSAYDAETQLIRCQYANHEGKLLDAQTFPPVRLEAEGQDPQSQVIQSRQPLLIDHYQEFSGKLPLCFEGQNRDLENSASGPKEDIVQSALIVPMLHQNRVVGTIQVFSCQTQAYSIENLHFLESISVQMAIALNNAQLFERAQQEIAERLNAESALRESEEKFRSVIEQAADGVMITDAQGRIVTWNQAQTQITGVAETDALGKPVWDLLNNLVQDVILDKLSQNEVRQAMITLLEDEQDDSLSGQIYEREIIRGDGHTRQVFSSVFRIGARKGEYRIVVLTRDVTQIARRHKELEVIARVNKSLRSTTSLKEVLQVVMDETTDLLGAVGTAAALYDPHWNVITIEMATGAWKGDLGKEFLPEEGLSHQVITTGQPYLDNDIHTQPAPSIASLPSYDQMNAVACYPLEADQHIGGVIWVGRALPFDEMDLRILELISDIAASAIDRARMTESRLNQIQRMLALRKIDRAISTGFDLGMNLNLFLHEAQTQLNADAAVILLYNPYMQVLEVTHAVGVETRALQGGYVRVGSGTAGQVVLDRKMQLVENLRANPVFYSFYARKEKSLNDDGDYRSYAAVPLIVKGQVKGVLELYFSARIKPSPDWLDFLDMLAGQAAIMIDNAEMFLDLQKSNLDLQMAYQSTLEGWVKALDMRDKETEGYTQRVTEMTVQFARHLGFSDEQLTHVRRGALLHDIGKMAVPDEILNKKGELSEEEKAVLRQHPLYAYQWLQSIPYLKEAMDVPYCHHERWDGGGYPRGLKGAEIPMSARMFTIVNVWNALRSNRPYRKALTDEEALKEIRAQAGKQFDPDLVAAFEQFLRLGGLEAF